jgi:hypothetical protein
MQKRCPDSRGRKNASNPFLFGLPGSFAFEELDRRVNRGALSYFAVFKPLLGDKSTLSGNLYRSSLIGYTACTIKG